MYNILLLSCDVKLLQKKSTFGRRRKKINVIIIIFSSISASLENLSLSSMYVSNCDDSNGFKSILMVLR